jgi:hypothetical protein
MAERGENYQDIIETALPSDWKEPEGWSGHGGGAGAGGGVWPAWHQLLGLLLGILVGQARCRQGIPRDSGEGRVI